MSEHHMEGPLTLRGDANRMPNSSLPAFLLARFDDDEQRLLGLKGLDAPRYGRGTAASQLADVWAKRRIVELHDGDHECSTFDEDGAVDNCTWVLIDERPCSTLLLLAAAYSDHPAFDERWKS